MAACWSTGRRESILRIGFVSIQDATDVKSWSGIPFQVLKHMRNLGVDVEVFSPLHSKAKYLIAPAKLAARARGKSVTLDHFRIVLQDYARQIDVFVKRHAIDVIFCPSTIPITLLKCSKPIVTWTDAVFHSMHEYYGKTFSNLTDAGVARGKWQEETALRNCQIAAFASHWAMEEASHFTERSKLRILPFGSSLPVTHNAEDVSRWATCKRSNRKNRCELLFVGTSWERKGGAIAVETAALLNDAGIETRLRVVGSKPEGEVPKFVELLGFINKSSESGTQKLIELFRSSDVFILPTWAEAAGIVFAEASSYGLPCVTYATGGVTDYVRHGVNGVCLDPGDAALRFAEEIRKMLGIPAEYESYARRAFEEYKTRLNWDSSVCKLVELCRQCASEA